MSTNNMTRAEVYSIIKSKGLQDACKEKFGKNFTQCSTGALIELINSNIVSKDAEKKVEQEDANINKEPVNNRCNCIDHVARAAIYKLIEILENNDAILSYEKDVMHDILSEEFDCENSSSSKPKSSSPYSDDEIDSMFADMNI